jgi:hypothetical protein
MKNIFRISGLILLILSIFQVYSCKKEKPTPPIVTTTTVSAISYTTATSGGDVTDEGGAPLISRGVCWNISAEPTVDNSKTTESGALGSFTGNLTQLTSNTMYYVRAYATNSAGTGYGNQVTFTTLTVEVPVLTTTEVTTITQTTAVSGGNITDDKGASVTARGVCWGTAPNPTTANNNTTDGTGIGSFVSNLTDLQPGTIYFIRSYATNSAGTSYGNEISFTTTATVPTLTTSEAFALTSTSVKIGGNITSDGGAVVTARGVCWSINAYPTITDSKTTEGTGSGVFTSFIPGLTPTSTYYIRAYATNSIGTVYGNQVTITTLATKLYLKTSYELSNYNLWLDGNNIYANGSPVPYPNPLSLMQTCQVDVNGDGQEDIVHYDSYPLNIDPTPNPPPSVFINNGSTLNKISWSGPSIKNPHGVKLLVGDFNNDSWPDVFSLVAVDPPNGAFPDLLDNCHLLFNSSSGFNRVKEFDDQLGFWYSGCSGDIDNDGDLDIIMFNFLIQNNGVKNKILWNDGQGNFTYDANEIGDIPLVDQSELIDVNNDGYLDLVLVYISSLSPRINDFRIMWGNGNGFGLNNSISYFIDGSKFLQDIDFADIDGNGIMEIFISGENSGNYFIEIYGSDNNGASFVNKTTQYFDNNICTRFSHLRVQDIDNNGRLDIFSTDKSDNIWWEFNGTKFIKK